jgi:ATP-dependent Lon protease
MLEDVTDARAAWMADILVGTVNASFTDKLGTF